MNIYANYLKRIRDNDRTAEEYRELVRIKITLNSTYGRMGKKK